MLPDHTPLESWGDAEPRAGVRSLIQPTIRPLFDTQALGDTLLAVGRAISAGRPRPRCRRAASAASSRRPGRASGFRAALERGGELRRAARAVARLARPPACRSRSWRRSSTGEGEPRAGRLPARLPLRRPRREPALAPGDPGPRHEDRLVELGRDQPQDAAERSASSAATSSASRPAPGRVEVRRCVRGGIRDDVVAIPIGQGHTVGLYASRAGDGLPGEARGVNVLDVLPADVDERRRARLAHGRRRALRDGRVRGACRCSSSATTSATASSARRSRWSRSPSGNGHAEAAAGGHGEPAGAQRRAHEIDVALRPHQGRRRGQPLPLGHVDRPRPVHRLQRLRGRLLRREQHPGRRRGARSGACAPMSWLRIERWIGDGEPDLESGREHPAPEPRDARRGRRPPRADDVPALRRGALRAGLPGASRPTTTTKA